jgi:non-ribosomal peptide synthetase component F
VRVIVNVAIHRLIEERVASHGGSLALVDGPRSLTYRALNEHANRVARYLILNGFKLGSLAVVRLERGCDLAVILLGILKAGGSYAWIDDDTRADDSWPRGLSIVQGSSETERRCLALDLTPVLRAEERSPNLPILTRSTDVACVLQEMDGSPMLMVPHATIAALRHTTLTGQTRWSGEPGALDLWFALMTGATISVGQLVETAA